MRFQPSPHSYGVISADQIFAAAQLTTAAAGAGTSLSRTFRKKRRRRRRGRSPDPAPPPAPPVVEPEKSKAPLILGGIAVLLAMSGVGFVLYKRRKGRG